MILGSNLIKNVNGAIIFETDDGKQKDLFKLEKSGQDLFLTVEIRDEHGELIAKLNRNSFVFTKGGIDGRRKFETKQNPNSFILFDKEHNIELFNAFITKNGGVTITGVFYMDSIKIEITDKYLKINGMHMSTCIVDGFKHAIVISHHGIKIGAK
jgi:hypothetical protein